MRAIPVTPLPVEPLRELIGDERTVALEAELAAAARALSGRRVWNLNSTATGGGVAEMLPRILGYLEGAGVAAPWLVIEAEPEFFAVTKRLHHALHGMPGDGGLLGEHERCCYEAALDSEAQALIPMVGHGDIAVLHDQPVLGLAGALQRAGVTVIFRSHIGADRDNPHTARAWSFLAPYLDPVDTFVFSRHQYAPSHLPGAVAVMAPTIDPLSEKNRTLDDSAAAALVRAAGLTDGIGDPHPPLVVQVSRWDPLKDPVGLIEAFAQAAANAVDGAHLVLAGPDVSGVTDDPEGADVLARCEARWRALPDPLQRRVHLLSLPMDDPAENFRMVNALQRRAAVVVQKSLAEGFGLTVTEAMWKARPVLASAVGGIIDQIVDGRHGRLLPDPTDTGAVAAMLSGLLGDAGTAEALGAQARERVRAEFLDDRQLTDWARLLTKEAA